MLEQGSYSACWSKAQRPLEQISIEMIGAVLNDRLVGARLDSQGHWSNARQCLPEQGSTAPGARLDRDDRSNARRSLGWSQAPQPRALEQGSTVPAWSKAQRPLEQISIEMIGAVLNGRLVGARLDSQGHWSNARHCLPEQGSTAPGARLDKDDRSNARRSWLEPGSTTKGTGARLDIACRS